MRNVGRITEWKDDRGFGFATPHGGGPRVFVHVSAFQPGSRRPIVGDLVSYEPAVDAKGRPAAANARFAGQRIRPTPRRPDVPRFAIASVFALLLGGAVAMRAVPAAVGAVYLAMSACAYFLYAGDKTAAGRGGQRTPESTLHAVDLLGGWPGALVAQQRLRHKTVKATFQVTFWLTVASNLAGMAWLVFSDAGRELLAGLAGA